MGSLELDLTEFMEEEKKTRRAKSKKLKTEKDRYKSINAGLPSPTQAKIDMFKTDKRVQWSFTCIPRLIKTKADERAGELGMGKKEFLYHCLRLGGVDIPEYSELDARKVIK